MTTKVKWPQVLKYENLDQAPLLRWIDLGNATMFRLSAYFVHGGYSYPGRGLVVGIERVGMWFFKIHSDSQWFRWGYVAEKLFLPESDARAIADWINAQIGFEDTEQQGEYNPTYIREVEPYGLGGENFVMPLVPVIIE